MAIIESALFLTVKALPFKPGFHLQQTSRPRHRKQSDYVIERSSFAFISLFWLEIGRNLPYGNQALQILLACLRASYKKACQVLIYVGVVISSQVSLPTP